jgi:hypothetical protein
MTENPGHIGRMGLVEQLQQMGSCAAAIQTPDGVEDDHPLIADQFFFYSSFRHNVHQTGKNFPSYIALQANQSTDFTYQQLYISPYCQKKIRHV